MRFYDEYDTEYYEENNSVQNGMCFRKCEKSHADEKYFGWDRDQAHEERKRRAALYIRAHFVELMKEETYRTAYNKLVDELARQHAYIALQKPICVVTEQERETEGAMLDFEIAFEGRKKVEQYKADAAYIVDWIKSGKNMIVYRR